MEQWCKFEREIEMFYEEGIDGTAASQRLEGTQEERISRMKDGKRNFENPRMDEANKRLLKRSNNPPGGHCQFKKQIDKRTQRKWFN